MTTEELERLIEGQAESQSLDFKGDCPWDVKKFAKDFLAMANVRDGGTILIGIKEENRAFSRQGVSPHNLATYKIDDMRDQFRKFADPSVNFSVRYPKDKDGLEYVAIQIQSFSDLPIICVADSSDTNKATIYYRNTDGRVSSGPISNSNDLQEIIEIAAIRLRKKREDYGYIIKDDDKEKLDQELDGL